MSDPSAAKMTRVENDFVFLERDSTGFVKVTAKIIDHDLEEAKVCGAFIHDACVEAGRRTRVLVDMRKARSLTREARVYYTNDDRAADILGTALLVDSGLSRVIGNFVMTLNKVAMPIRLFKDEASARAWLQSLPDR